MACPPKSPALCFSYNVWRLKHLSDFLVVPDSPSISISNRDTRSPSNPAYNISGVLLSLSHRALRTIYPTASSFTILNLRSAATVNCPPVSNQTLQCYKRPCLFDLERDPCETTDVAQQNTFVAEALYNRLVAFRATLVPQSNKPPEPVLADPRRHNHTWSIWAL
ncbi:hypothetical protein J6590_046770 [Homalodisca vitripennis]|nr:hypothetical protein J6590_046770 [Homalodisca vitripennis]